MYADDLILLSISVNDMQRMIDLCNKIFRQLDLTINIDKFHCMRIGPRFKNHCTNLCVNNQPLSWVDKTKFLGITILSGNCFIVDWHEARSNFYKTSNAIFGSLGSNPPIDVCLKLITSKCLPILMYGMSAVTVTSKELNNLCFAYNSVFYKLFRVKSKQDIAFCQYHCGYWDFCHLLNYYRFCFLSRLYVNGELNTSADERDLLELELLSRQYNLNYCDTKYVVRKNIWKFVENSMLPLMA
jgi:hypothetical protein